jgi:hypothetical protein
MTPVAVLFSLAGFVALVALLSAKNTHRTEGRACCAPADPRQDLRMRTVWKEKDTGSAVGRSGQGPRR